MTKNETRKLYASLMLDVLRAAAQTGTEEQCAEVMCASLGGLLCDQDDDTVKAFLDIVYRARADMASMMADQTQTGTLQ